MKRLIISLLCITSLVLCATEQTPDGTLAKADKLKKQGNFKDAYDVYKKLSNSSETPDKVSSKALNQAIYCLQRLNRMNEIDKLLVDSIKSHEDDWRTLQTAAKLYMRIQHSGFIIAGEFERGHHRGGGKMVSSYQRDRVESLRLYSKVIELAEKKSEPAEFYNIIFEFAGAIMHNRGYAEAWRLQYLTNLKELPDYEEGVGYYYFGWRSIPKGAPVDKEGNPVLYYVPESFENAANDGERWRWLLNKAIETQPAKKDGVRTQFANFLQNQFSVQTMAYGGFSPKQNDFEKDESGPYAVHTLKDSETIARLATGIKRFELPDEFNFIKIFRSISQNKQKNYGEPALRSVANIYSNRRQYPKAAEIWKESIDRFGPGLKNRKIRSLNQIIGNWGRFEPLTPETAEENATFEYRFRNGKEVTFEAYEVKVKKLLDDVKAYLKSNPAKPDWKKSNIGNIGHKLVYENQSQYVGDKVTEWKQELTPAKGHYDSRITIKSPLKKAGAYLVVAKLADGNTCRIIVWLNNTVIVKKQMDNKTMLFVADAETGAPVNQVDLDMFGYHQKYVGRRLKNAYSRKYETTTTEKQVTGGNNGLTILSPKEMDKKYTWLITATTNDGRFAYLGFQRIWFSSRHDSEYNQRKTFLMTDRPVYRPNQKVNFKFWVRHAKYDRPDTSDFANQVFTCIIRNPKNEEVYKKSITSDEFGGIAGEFELKDDAALGNYYIFLKNYGGGSFRVEEYKKPEYEVTVEAPKEPVKLGDKIEAEIKAKYYFGAPVTQAKVKYKVLRTKYNDTWYPIGIWDWMYGNGYWWFAPDYGWYPGWRKWGCGSPFPWWGYRRSDPPEVVMEDEVEIGKDGTVKVQIDSSVAKELFGDSDHKYEITAEVVDLSRRTIVGKGSVIAARKPFKVTAWVNRGYYRIGDTVVANFAARTVDGKPVMNSKGRLSLFKIEYNEEAVPKETEVDKWELDTNATGAAMHQIKAAESGQYRLSYTVTDKKGNSIEGGYIFSICGTNDKWTADKKSFRFNDLELMNDKKDYEPGEKVKMMINTERSDSFVLLFVRPSNGVYLQPRTVQLKGKSAFELIEVVKKDMPNFFVEAMTISNGRLHTVVKEIIVPPEKRVLNVEVLPSEKKYKPGEKAKVNIKITDFFGKPISSSAVVTIYDKSVEYISGGSNVQAIKPFFWKWRRRHNSSASSSIQRYFNNLYKKNELSMRNLGVFGNMTSPDQQSISKGLLGKGGGGSERFKSKRASNSLYYAKSEAAPDMGMDAESAPMEEMEMNDKDGAWFEKGAGGTGGDAGGTAEPAVTVRKNFADTAYWSSSITPDENGMAEIELDMPENLTTWKIKVWGMANGTKVGEGSTEVITSKDLIIRLQSPRFFVEKDEVTLSAIVHNYLDSEKEAKISLKLGGNCLELMDKSTLTQTATIEKGGEVRINWVVKALKEGEATIQMAAITDEESDAMEMKFPVLVHGIMKQIPFTGSIPAKFANDKAVAKFEMTVPDERRIEESLFELRYSPTLAGAMVDALPYLVSYPYGCTEQTLNRFLPTVITRKVLKDMGLNLADIKEKRANLNAQEIGDDQERAKQWKKRAIIIGYESNGDPIYTDNPVFDEEIVDDMISEGIKRLRSMQNSDGGWGWFSGWNEYSYPHTTATVVHGLQAAKKYGAKVPQNMIDSGIKWLRNYQAKEVQKLNNAEKKTKPYKTYADNLDSLVFMILTEAEKKDASLKADQKAMLEYLYRDRNHLSVYGKCTLGIGVNHWLTVQYAAEKSTVVTGLSKQLAMIMKNIEQFLVKDAENQTAYLNLQNGGYWWYWYGSEYEAQAYYLKLLCATNPKSDTSPWLVKYLLNNRKHSTYWNSTRDTALVVEAFADYIKATGEDKPDMTLEVLFDGKVVKTVKINKDNIFSYDNKVILKGKKITSGKHNVEIRRKGQGPVYWNAYLDYFSLEDFITKAGLEIKVERKYYKLEKVEKTIKVQGARGQALDQKVEKYERRPVKNLDTLKSGDLVEIELVMFSKNDYEYIIFEDMKPAGFEPTEVKSGYNGNDMGAYVQFRDEKVCFFVRRLARGKHSLSYRMIAEIPGKFSALPTKGFAMYAPELKANSDEIKLKVIDKE